MINATQKIQGKNRFDVFERLKKEKTLIRIKMERLDHEEWTTITDVRTKGKTHFFIIRPPNKFIDTAAGYENGHIDFEFNSKDGMQFVFICTSGKILDEEVWIPFPEFIQQIQRRSDFRLGFQGGTILNFEIDRVKYKMDLINLSMGGCCAEIPAIKDEPEKSPVLKTGDSLLDVNIVSSLQEDNLEVQIKKASIIRVDDRKNNNGYRLGLQFVDIEREEVNKLKKMIYDLQRYFLQRRLKPDI